LPARQGHEHDSGRRPVRQEQNWTETGRSLRLRTMTRPIRSAATRRRTVVMRSRVRTRRTGQTLSRRKRTSASRSRNRSRKGRTTFRRVCRRSPESRAGNTDWTGSPGAGPPEAGCQPLGAQAHRARAHLPTSRGALVGRPSGCSMPSEMSSAASLPYQLVSRTIAESSALAGGSKGDGSAISRVPVSIAA
jgi:hypothetical protein